jgi:hypothetical protein
MAIAATRSHQPSAELASLHVNVTVPYRIRKTVSPDDHTYLEPCFANKPELKVQVCNPPTNRLRRFPAMLDQNLLFRGHFQLGAAIFGPARLSVVRSDRAILTKALSCDSGSADTALHQPFLHLFCPV